MEWSDELSGGLLRAVPDAIMVLAAGRIALINDRAEDLFGYPPAALLGEPAERVLAGSGWAEHDQQVRASDGPDGPLGHPVLTVRRRDGHEFPAEIALSAVRTPQGRCVVAVIRDVSGQPDTEAERSRLSAEVDRQARAAQLHRTRRLKSLGQLAGVVAHDFNNMLGVIVNYAGFVIEEAAAPTPDLTAVGSDAEQIVRAAQRGTEVTRRLLAYARRDPAHPRVLDLDAVLAQVEPALRDTVGRQVTLIIQPGDKPQICADPEHVQQLLVNLAHNAREAMPDGGRLVIDVDVVVVDGADAPADNTLTPGGYVRLRAVDSGSGMPPDVVERAFEPFFTTKGGGEGAGVGLAIVDDIVAQAGGSVTIASEPGVGTTVTVLLPVAG